MYWMEKLSALINDNRWGDAVIYLQDEIRNNPDNKNLYIDIMYLCVYILMETDYGKNDYEKYEKIIKDNFILSYSKYYDDAEYLFFMAFEIAWVDYLFGQKDDKLLVKMINKAIEKDPSNMLYKWCVYINTRGNSEEIEKIVHDHPEYSDWLKTQGYAGNDVEYFYKTSCKQSD